MSRIKYLSPFFYCPVDVSVDFVIDQPFEGVFLSEAVVDTIPMFPYTPPYFIRDANIERSVASIRHDVNVIHYVLALDTGSSPV